jgi:protein SCO1/2
MRCWVMSVVLLVMIGSGGCAQPHTFSGTVVEPPFEVPTVTLTDSKGEPFALGGEAGKTTLVYFGYTHCPDVCPLTMQRLKEATAELSEAERAKLRVLFVTVDPARDTPGVLGEYVGRFDPTWVGLTGESAALDEALQGYGVLVESTAAHEHQHEAGEAYEVSHSDRIFVLREPGSYGLILHSDVPREVLVGDLRALVGG